MQTIPAGRQNGRSSWFLPRHFHDRAYASVVLSGGYEESGNWGRFRVRAGDVLLHSAFDAHLNRGERKGATILNLALRESPTGFRAGSVGDLDLIARTAESDPRAAVELMLAQLQPISPCVGDWEGLLAVQIARDPSCRLDSWANEHGIARETLSRGFAKTYGTTAASFRAETRARHALEQIINTEARLADVAVVTGFADQAHMTRAVRALTGQPPGYWRQRSNSYKTRAVNGCPLPGGGGAIEPGSSAIVASVGPVSP
jgi:AraC-like DNA-binding protein